MDTRKLEKARALRLQHWTDSDAAHGQESEYLSPIGYSEPVADVWGGPELAAELVRRFNAFPALVEALEAFVREVDEYGFINSQDNDPEGAESPAYSKAVLALEAAKA